MSLQDEIDARSKEIQTDSYPMSIGELMNIYRDSEIELTPEFQRFFRWSVLQKSRLIESLLLGIPIPSVFVAQRPNDGVWEVIDGLQRLSTIFEFAGILKDRDGDLVKPVALAETKYLPSLKGKVWDDSMITKEGESSLDPSQRLAIKRTKLALNIVKRESSPDSKLELFHRLNSFGTSLSDQEQRDCLVLLVNRKAFEWASDLATDKSFLTTTNLTERMLELKYDRELVWRFTSIRYADQSSLSKISDMKEFLDDASIAIAKDTSFEYAKEELVFRTTFRFLTEALGENAFRQYDPSSGKFTRAFLISSFEATAIGLSNSIALYEVLDPQSRSQIIQNKVKRLWESSEFLSNMGSGKTPARRLANIPKFSTQLFSDV